MSYTITREQSDKQLEEYKKKYPPFIRRHLTSKEATHIAKILNLVLSTQNGQDTDNKHIENNNIASKLLSRVPKNSKVLFLGTGTGKELLVAQSEGFDAYGTTLGTRNIGFGIDCLGLTSDKFTECFNEALPFEKETFDAVIGIQIFEHAIAPLLFLLEAGRVLKPSGQLLLEWPPPLQERPDGTLLNQQGDAHPHHQICYTPGQAKSLLEKAGFENVDLFFSSIKEEYKHLDGQKINSEDYWKGHFQTYLAISGVKSGISPPDSQYINKVWNL